jgi:hypothetical protein
MMCFLNISCIPGFTDHYPVLLWYRHASCIPGFTDHYPVLLWYRHAKTRYTWCMPISQQNRIMISKTRYTWCMPISQQNRIMISKTGYTWRMPISQQNRIYNYLCNQCLSPLTLWAWIPFRRGVLHTTLCDKVCQCLTAGRWFSLGRYTWCMPISQQNRISQILLAKEDILHCSSLMDMQVVSLLI